MAFELFGFDISEAVGFHLCQLTDWKEEEVRSLFTIYYVEGEWIIDLGFIRVWG